MSKYEKVGYKVTQTRMYSEVVYYTPDGTEVSRSRVYDDHLHDDSGCDPLDANDLDFYPDYDEDNE